HPVLHSFPTRRSSDLLDEVGIRQKRFERGESCRGTLRRRADRPTILCALEIRDRLDPGHGLECRSHVRDPLRLAVEVVRILERGDRKSTRLNSSHEWI